jgi:hypothetical protein
MNFYSKWMWIVLKSRQLFVLLNCGVFFYSFHKFYHSFSQLVKPSINLMLIGLNWHDEYWGIPIQFKLTFSKFPWNLLMKETRNFLGIYWWRKLEIFHPRSFLIDTQSILKFFHPNLKLNILTEITKCKTILWKVLLFWKLEIDIDG